MGSQDNVDRLFFELASQSRLDILCELQSKKLRMQQIAQRLDLTETETCRQLQRLSEAQLAQKQPDGTYALTTYAKLILDLSLPMKFVFKNKEFFLNHDLFLLPKELRTRLGDLSESRMISATIETINYVADMVKDAQKWLDSIILGLITITELMGRRRQEGLKIRWIIEENLIPKMPAILDSWQQLPEIRVVPTANGHYTVTDKAAILTLRRNDGTMGYSSFVSTDSSFLKWTEELFVYEWQRAKPWHP